MPTPRLYPPQYRFLFEEMQKLLLFSGMAFDEEAPLVIRLTGMVNLLHRLRCSRTPMCTCCREVGEYGEERAWEMRGHQFYLAESLLLLDLYNTHGFLVQYEKAWKILQRLRPTLFSVQAVGEMGKAPTAFDFTSWQGKDTIQ